MTRQYKTMQTEMGLRIHKLETDLLRTRQQLGNEVYFKALIWDSWEEKTAFMGFCLYVCINQFSPYLLLKAPYSLKADIFYPRKI